MSISNHFLFNFETVASSLAIVASIYTLLLERRFRARIAIKAYQKNIFTKLIACLILFAFVGAILPHMPGESVLFFGYPIFWEILSAIVFICAVLLAYLLLKPIKSLSERQIKSLAEYAPHVTLKFQGDIDLILKELEYFWLDLLSKSVKNNLLRDAIVFNFSQVDFLKLAVKSHYILFSTTEFISRANVKDDIEHVKDFFKKYVYVSLLENDSILGDDIDSSHKDIMQDIVRKKKLTDDIFGNLTALSFLHGKTKHSTPKLLNSLVDVFELYLGRKYHHTEDNCDYLKLVKAQVLKSFFVFFKDNLYALDDRAMSKFVDKIGHCLIDLKNLPKKQSEVVVDGIYEIMEYYENGRNWTDNYWHVRHQYLLISRVFFQFNDYAKKVFKQRLLDRIIGSTDENNTTYYANNLTGYYPMMIPAYFFLYGMIIFSDNENNSPREDMEMHMTILRKMQKNLPMIANGTIQEYFGKDLPRDERGLNIIKRRSEKIINDMFPPNMIYDKQKNALTYIFGNDEVSKTILLNFTVRENRIIFEEG